MKHLATLLTTLFMVCFTVNVRAQPTPKFSTPLIKQQNGFLLISYDIRGGEENDQYRIILEVTDVEGKKIRANTLTGDVGKDVSGGSGKMIIWNYEKDGAFIDDGIFVEILGEVTYRASMEAPSRQQVEGVDYSLLGLMWRSAVFPGWGLTKATGSKLHLIKGGAGYASIAGAFILNNMAFNNQEKARDPSTTDIEEYESLKQTSHNQDVASKVLGFTAVAIWVSDLAWTAIVGAQRTGMIKGKQVSGVSIGSGFDPITGAPMLAFSYTF